MTEPLATGEAGTATEDESEFRYACPECGKPFKTTATLGGHRWREHDVAGTSTKKKPKRTSSGGTARPRSNAARLQRDLASGFKAVAMIPLMRNPGVLGDERVRDVIDKEAIEAADAWVAVAEKDARVAKWLNSMLTGSVWINASLASLTFTYSIAVFSGLMPLHPAVTMVVTDLAPWVQPAQAAPTPRENGNGSVEP